MKSIYKYLGWLLFMALAATAPTAAKEGFGTLSGVVLDPSGTPQMGATVWVVSEDAGGRTISQLLSNQYGAFFSNHLKPGKYALRVSLTGFLPSTEHHIPIMADLTTMLRVQMDSVFASLDTLRRKSDAAAEPDDWKWVLRSSAATRTVLQWRDSDAGAVTIADIGPDFPRAKASHGLVQLTNGSLRPGSSSNLPAAPATAMSYDQQLGNLGHVFLAGQASYERGTSEAFAGVWLPISSTGRDPETVFVMRQSKFGANGTAFQEMRIDHTEQLALTDRIALRAGAEYVRATLFTAVSALRPHAELEAGLAPGWMASLIVAANTPSAHWGQLDTLESALTELDSLPTVLFRNGDPVFEGGWHEEVAVKHSLTPRAKLEVAAFHDGVKNQAILGSGPATSPDFLQNAYSDAFIYDGGSSSSWGTRVAYRQKLFGNLEVSALYSWAGALTPIDALNVALPNARDNIVTRNHQSIAGRVSGKLPGTGTQFAASYKWVSGATLAPTDAFGEAKNQIDSNLRLSVRQPIPGSNGRWEALADFTNLLAQGYITASGQNARVAFVPVLRSFRGGVSFQF